MSTQRRCRWLAFLGLGMFVAASQIACAPADRSGTPPGGSGGGVAQAPADAPGDDEAAASDELPKVPLGLPEVPIPDDNPMTPAKVELGKMLYFDTRLSGDDTISCATCHDPKMAWAEDTPTSTGIHGHVGPVNSPTVINTAYATRLFWDGRSDSLEDQALGPMENPIEMGAKLEDVVKKLAEIPEYVERFKDVFDSEITPLGIAKALAAFERTVLSGNSPYDRFVEGDETALSDAQKRGWEAFQKANCDSCHKPPLFSNFTFVNAGVGMDNDPPDEGRKAVTGEDRDLGRYRVPPLREVANTAPYFHDGKTATLEEAVAMMAAGGIDNPGLSEMMRSVRDANLSDDDVQDIVEFLQALSGEYPIIDAPELP